MWKYGHILKVRAKICGNTGVFRDFANVINVYRALVRVSGSDFTRKPGNEKTQTRSDLRTDPCYNPRRSSNAGLSRSLKDITTPDPFTTTFTEGLCCLCSTVSSSNYRKTSIRFAGETRRARRKKPCSHHRSDGPRAIPCLQVPVGTKRLRR